MKIQKLCYLAHGYALATLDQPLLDELFEAWRFGPVLPSLYHAAKRHGSEPISEYLRDFDYESRQYVQASPPTEDAITEIIAFVWDNYAHMAPMELSNWTHEKGGPWDTVISAERPLVRNQDIPNDLIKEYFVRTMHAAAAPAA